MLIAWIIIFFIALVVLIKSSDYFTDSAERISLLFKVPPFIVAVTIVAVGTSLPELATSVASVFKDASEIVVANAVGSNIANILLVVGISAVVAGILKSKRSLIDLDLPVMGMAILIMLIIIWDRQINFFEGILALLSYAFYLFYIVYFRERKIPIKAEKKLERGIKEESEILHEKKAEIGKETVVTSLILIVSVVGIYFGAKYTVEAIVNIAEILNIAASTVVLTAVAIGTSLPELTVSVTAVLKKQYEISFGNIVGSNIFNAVVITGVPAMFGTVLIDDITFSLGIPFLIGATVIYIFSGISQKIHRLEGMIYLLIYVLFLGKLFALF